MEPTRADPSGSSRLPLLALAFGAVVIAATPILVRLATCGPAAAGFWRLAIATPILAVSATRGGGALPAPTRAAVLAGLAFALDLGCWHYGIRYTSIANATVLPNLTPVFVTLVSWVAFAERPRPVFVLGVLLAVGGAALMAGSALPSRPGPLPHLGDILSASTAIWYGLYFLAVRVARSSGSAAQVMLWSGLVAAPLLLLAAVVMREPLVPASAGGWAAVAALGVVHAVGQGAIAWSLGKLPASTASVTVLVQPVIAALLAFWLFGESLTPLQGLGGALALAGVATAQQAPARRRVSAPRPAPGP